MVLNINFLKVFYFFKVCIKSLLKLKRKKKKEKLELKKLRKNLHLFNISLLAMRHSVTIPTSLRNRRSKYTLFHCHSLVFYCHIEYFHSFTMKSYANLSWCKTIDRDQSNLFQFLLYFTNFFSIRLITIYNHFHWFHSI